MDEKHGEALPLILLASCSLLFILYNPFQQQEADKDSDETIQAVLQFVEGVGEVKAYLHYDNERESGGLFRDYFETEGQKKITGVLIVAEGAGNAQIKKLIKDAVADVLQIAPHRIVVVPMKKEE